jgi:ABC-2 type transport system ATP-binding protein
MLKCENITKIFDVELFTQPFTALKDLSFEIPKESVIGFLGANGAGKTTAIKIILDFIRANSGEIIFAEELGSNRQEVYQNIGYLPERPYFYPHLTGRSFAHYMGSLCDLKKDEIEKRIQELAPVFKIDHALERTLKTYSKGMLQRIGFLCTLLHKPKLVILDEPLSGLDPVGRKDLKQIITDINKEGTTVFFSSHIISDVEEICDDVIFIKDGELVFQGKVDELIADNVKGVVKIQYRDDVVNTLEVSLEEKEKKIRELMDNNYEILSVQLDKPTLEEIFYKV